MNAKNRRQRLILEMIAQQIITDQSDLLRCLADRGIHTTQSTLSRDMSELNIQKREVQGQMRYAKDETPQERITGSRLLAQLSLAITSYKAALNMVIVKSLPGTAQGLAAAMDSMSMEEVIGTIAGDDTIFLATESEALAQAVLVKLDELCKGHLGKQA